MIINLNLDSSAQAAPTATKNAWTTAANMIASWFTDNITINLNVTYTGTGGGASAGPSTGAFVSYQTVYNYLTTHASPGDTTFASLPNATSISGQSWTAVWHAQERLAGLVPANDVSIDGSATFATDISASLMVGVALHEFTHAMGRVPFGPPDSSGSGDTASPDIMEFLRFSSQGNRFFDDNIPTSASYFSLDGGLTKWFDYGQSSDPSDWLNSGSLSPNDAFNEFYSGSTLQYLTLADLEQMVALGYHLKEFAPAVDSHDFRGDNAGDILLQNSSGQITYANMVGGTFQQYFNLTNTPGWTVVGEGKISGGVDANVVIENSSGAIEYGNMANGSLTGWTYVATAPGYTVVGVGDINRDYHADIILQNSSGGNACANMANGVFTSWVALPDTPGYAVRAVADVNDDGYADIIFQNSSGTIVWGNMAGGVFNSFQGVTGTPGWTVVGAGDLNRDGYADIVVQNNSSGEIVYANMANGTFSGWVSVASTPGWSVVAVEDVIGNGYQDIVVENFSSGQVVYANMTGGTFQGFVNVATTAGYTAHTAPASANALTTSADVTAPENVAAPVKALEPEHAPAASNTWDHGWLL